MIVLLYRKPKYHKNFPWQQMCRSAQDAVEFINDLGRDYDAKAFSEISIKKLQSLADKGE